ncbi:MAG TPA: TonB-dependent receptor [Acidobacteriaceae bacterium]|jgi:hypothetical protein
MKSYRSKYLSFAAASILGLVFVAQGYSQSQSINGTIRGQITDGTGAPVPNATVVVKSADTGYTRTITTDTDGNYLAPNLPLGTYSVATTSGAFAPYTQRGIHVDAGSDLTVNEALKVGTVATEVEVSSDAPIVEGTRVDLSRTISEVEVQNQPLTSRNPYNFILFQPGVSGHPNPENGIPRTVNTNGLVDRVNYQLDGMVDTETDRYGLRLFAISDSYVKEVQANSNAYNAEFGNTAGVIYNVITPGGTNHLHGMAQYIWRPKAAASCPILQNCATVHKPDLHVDDYVAQLGGPVIRNRMFLFGAYEKLKRANPVASTINAATQSFLVASGISPTIFAAAPQVQRAQWVDIRGDININQKNSMFVRYNYFRNTYPYNTNAGGLYALDAASDFRDRAHIIGAQLITTFKPSLLNEFRGSWPYRNEAHINSSTTGAGPMVTIGAATLAAPVTVGTTVIPAGSYSGVNFGGSNGVGDRFQEKIPSFNDNVTWIVKTHQLKFGVAFQKNNDTQLADVYTQYTFASPQQYLSAKQGATPHVYSSVAASIGRPGAGYQSVFVGFFAQDTWQVAHNLTLNYGVRYDQYRAPAGQANAPFAYTQSFHSPKGNFAPRLGVAYTPFAHTVIRASGGIYYESTPTNTWYNPLYNNGAYGTGSFIYSSSGLSTEPAPGVTTCQPGFPNSPAGVIAGCPIAVQSIYALSPNFKNEYTWNGNLQVAQALGHNDQVTIGYVITQGRNLQFLRNLNLINPINTLADGRPVYASAVCLATTTGTPATGCPVNATPGTGGPASRLYPQFNNITLIDTGSNSSYNALIVSYEHRMSAGLTVAANYSWSHSISDTPEANTYEFSTPVEDPSNPGRDHANSSINRPNAFTLSTVYEPKTHFDNKYVNGIFTNNLFAVLGNFSSGDEQSITTTTKLNGDSTATSRPLFIGRNTLRTPLISQVDMRYTRTFATLWEHVKPQVFIEANNLLNRSNFTTINTTATVTAAGVITGTPSLAPTASVLEARILQFGAKVQF